MNTNLSTLMGLSPVAAAINSGMGSTGRRAAYVMISNQATTTFGAGYALYDEDFNFVNYDRLPGGTGVVSSATQFTAVPCEFGNVVVMSAPTEAYSGYSSQYSWLAGDWTNSSGTNPSTSSTLYHGATFGSGEFGHASTDNYSDGTFKHSGRGGGTNNSVKAYLNAYAINSDHPDKRTVYILYNGVLRAVDRLNGSYNYDKAGTTAYTIPSINTSMQGSASYNYARKELTIISYTATGGSFTLYTYSGIDFNLYPSPAAAFAATGVTLTVATVSLASNWVATNDTESYYNLKPVVSNAGTVWIPVFFTTTKLALYKATRSGTSGITATYVTALATSTTAAYGAASGINYAAKQITSRDGTSVCIFSPYYYYGSGICAFMIDKANDTYASFTVADSGYGYQPLPYKDSGWAFFYCGNGYGANQYGAYIYATYVRNGTGLLTQNSSTIYLPYFAPSNATTNYPAMTQVVDYNLLTSNVYGAK